MGEEPPIGELRTAVQGEAIYTKFDYPAHQAARLLEPAQKRAARFDAGEILLGFVSNQGTERFCTERQTSFLGMKSTVAYCLLQVYRSRPERKFDHFSIAGGSRSKLKSTAAYELLEVTAPEQTAEQWLGDFYKFEIVYQGAAGGILRLLYREYVNSLARPAFSQELTYDLPEESPLTVSVKEAKVEVLDAGNAGIRYRVLQGPTD